MTAWVGLGSNLGARRAALWSALDALDQLPQTRVAACSPLYRTAPWGDSDQPGFVNAVARLDTALEPLALLRALLNIEDMMGRTRDERRWGPRRIDLDILLYDGVQCSSDELVIPHPRMHERAFVLVPLADLDPELELPGRGSIRSCLERLGRDGVDQIPTSVGIKFN